jgi:hypothetical protein
MSTYARQRRWILRGIAALGAIRITRALAVVPMRPARDPVVEHLLSYPTSLSSARVIGREYLTTHREEQSIQMLMESIVPCAPDIDVAVDGRLSRIDVHRYVYSRILSDFEVGDVIQLQGWILSVTEIRLCALIALI